MKTVCILVGIACLYLAVDTVQKPSDMDKSIRAIVSAAKHGDYSN